MRMAITAAAATMAILAATLSAFAQQVGACEELTGLQVAAGFVTWMNVMRVFAIAVGAACLGFLLLRFFRHVPVQAYLGLGYVASAALVASGAYVDPSNQMWPVLGGSLLFGIVLWISEVVHRVRTPPSAFFGILFAVWAAVASFYMNEAVGFLAVAAFMGMLGFSAMVIPMGYAVGFSDDGALPRATSAAFVVLALYVAVRASGYQNPYLETFEPGGLWMGSFVGFLGILISASRWNSSGIPYVARQAVAVIAGLSAIGIGSVLQMPELFGVGGTFFALYLIEKPFDIPAESLTAYATIGLAVSSAVGGAVFWAQNNMETVAPYLLF